MTPEILQKANHITKFIEEAKKIKPEISRHIASIEALMKSHIYTDYPDNAILINFKEAVFNFVDSQIALAQEELDKI